jgi:hypothetical protein
MVFLNFIVYLLSTVERKIFNVSDTLPYINNSYDIETGLYYTDHKFKIVMPNPNEEYKWGDVDYL